MGGLGHRQTLEQRIASRNKRNLRQGHEEGWADEALDFYLEGLTVREIIDHYKVSTTAFYNSIAKAALYRLMKERNCERMDEMEELTDAKT